MHRHGCRGTGIDRAGRAELLDRHGRRCRLQDLGRDAGALLPEQQDAALRQVEELERLGACHVVHRDHRQPLLPGPGQELLSAGVVAQMLVAIRDHGPAPVPAAAPDDVHLPGQEGIRGAHHRADVEVVAPVLDRHVEAVAPLVEGGHDGLQPPVAELVDHVAAVAVAQQLGVPVLTVRPWALPRADADLVRPVFRRRLSQARARPCRRRTGRAPRRIPRCAPWRRWRGPR